MLNNEAEIAINAQFKQVVNKFVNKILTDK